MEQEVAEVNRNFLMYVAEVSEIPPDDLEKLFYNGFDNPESIELCTIDNLEKLGIENADEVIQRLLFTVQFWKESHSEEPQSEQHNQQQ